MGQVTSETIYPGSEPYSGQFGVIKDRVRSFPGLFIAAWSRFRPDLNRARLVVKRFVQFWQYLGHFRPVFSLISRLHVQSKTKNSFYKTEFGANRFYDRE